MIGEDSDGLKILWELLNLACTYSYGQYMDRGITQEIFVDTMRFCNRFLREHYQTYGTYKYVWAWWFPRQISLWEFRIGALEYEFVDGDDREICIHIPSDADMTPKAVLQSLKAFYEFRVTYFPEWGNVRLSCNTWMLAPAMEELLAVGSNILAFKHMFELEQVESEATWYMEWIFPGYEGAIENLPEKTSLQRNVKAYLLTGKTIGVAKGWLKNEIS